MNPMQAVVNTGAATFGVAQLSDILQWLINGHPTPVPEDVTLGLAAFSLPVLHLLYSAIAAVITNLMQPKGSQT